MLNELPLKDITVFELCSNLAGPYAAWILAELGADVIKIERPEGDDARSWGPPFWNGTGTIFHTVNRNKKSVSMDLKEPDVAAGLRARIAEDGDVFIQNLRPGAAQALGFSAETLTAANPRLIYCNLFAFGAKGPLKDYPGYDTLMQAFGGVMSVTGEDGRPPLRAGISVIDMGTGMWCAIGILTALYRRNVTGKGGVVDASLFETALGWMAWHATSFQATGKLPGPSVTGAQGIVPYQAYQCADGPLIIAASNDRLFVKLARALDHPEWAQDERFRTNPRRVENREEMNRLLEPILIKAPRGEWQKRLDEAGVPNSPVQSIDEVLAHPQTSALGIAQQTGDESMKLIGLPISLDGERPGLRNIAPALGQDNDTW
jgi:crotonobetainyl-CoA:carnitine CoA-transferase CaiB-like acyl-CoA transferase